jgi:hypothetical protein
MYAYEKTIEKVTRRKISVKNKMFYVEEKNASWSSIEPKIVEENYEYVVELDSIGRVTGGEWISFARPDFTWNVEITAFSGYMSIVRDIYIKSIRGNSRNTNLGKIKIFL